MAGAVDQKDVIRRGVKAKRGWIEGLGERDRKAVWRGKQAGDDQAADGDCRTDARDAADGVSGRECLIADCRKGCAEDADAAAERAVWRKRGGVVTATEMKR